jgi:hypothetical protein
LTRKNYHGLWGARGNSHNFCRNRPSHRLFSPGRFATFYGRAPRFAGSHAHSFHSLSAYLSPQWRGIAFGYWFGKKTGPAIFDRNDSIIFKKKYIHETQAFYEKHGRKTIILARFMPVVRTFAPIMAGVANMNYRVFISFKLSAGFIWSVGVTLGGYFLGKTIPNADPTSLLSLLSSFSPHLYLVLCTCSAGKRLKM